MGRGLERGKKRDEKKSGDTASTCRKWQYCTAVLSFSFVQSN